MVQKCTFNEKRDLGQVAVGLAIDLQKAIDSGIVLDSTINLDVNEIENPGDVWCRIHDIFDAVEKDQEIRQMYRNEVSIQEQNKSTSQEVV